MGVYDREYIRREGGGFLKSLFTDSGAVCKWLIVLNVLVYVLQLATSGDRGDPGWLTRALWLDPSVVLHGHVWRLVTYAFLHDPFMVWHILFNMLFLWWFGREMEDVYGSREFLAFYLGGVLAGAVAFMPWALRVASPQGPPVCLGASGAVTAVMVLYALHFPKRVIYIWFVLPVPIWLFVAFQVAQDTFLLAGSRETGTAVAAHLGGAAFGLAYYKLGWRLSGLFSLPASWARGGGRARRPALRVYRDDEPEARPERPQPPRREPRPTRQPAPVAAATAPPPDLDDQLEARVDAVLEKVARHGRDSLTESEKALLVHASEVYKRRRS